MAARNSLIWLVAAQAFALTAGMGAFALAASTDAAGPAQAPAPVALAAYSPEAASPEDGQASPEALMAEARAPAGPQEPPRAGSNPNGALLQNLRRYQAKALVARDAPPAPAAPAPAAPAFALLAPPAPAPGPASTPMAVGTPLPPSRPSGLAADAPPEAGVPPLPPARPRELAALAAPAPAAPASAEPAAPARPPISQAEQTISLAALQPQEEKPAAREDGGFRMGAPVFIRIFKQEAQLELWLKRDGRWALYRTYPICKWSGQLGPKLRFADYQSPEGFYSVSAKQLNPNSHYHRAFNVGYPNAFDRQNGRTGSAVMVHGACKSVGCFAMTDQLIEEIYGFVEAALRSGQREAPVHIFPFRMTDEAMAKATAGDWTNWWTVPSNHQQWASFWRNLKDGYDLFEKTGEPPAAYACGDRYAFGTAGQSCTRIAGW